MCRKIYKFQPQARYYFFDIILGLQLISREIAGYLFSKFYQKKQQLLGMMFQLADDIQILWESQPIQEAYERRNEFQIVECAKYFLTKVHQVMHEDYVPTEDDIVNTRVKTVGKEKKYPCFKIAYHFLKKFMTFLGIIEHEFEMKMESGSSKKNRTLILVCITMNYFINFLQVLVSYYRH